MLLTASHLGNNPRAVKEADALEAAGFDVEILGWITDPVLQAEDREIAASRPWAFAPFVDLLQPSIPNRLRSLAWRVERRIASALAMTTGVHSASQLGGWRWAMLAAARRRKADLFIAHSAATIWVGTQLQREGRNVGVDMEDWFSREHPEPYPSALVAACEARLIGAATHAASPSKAMSQAIALEYRVSPPTVVYNAFPWGARERLDGLTKDRAGGRRYSIHWYSQTLGEGRGLEDLLAALPHVTGEVEVHLRGTLASGGREWLDRHIPAAYRDRVHVHGRVSNAELLSRIAEHDIGFAGEAKAPAARDLTVSNKILQYLLAGLAVVASETRGQREVAEGAPGAVFLYRPGEPLSLAAQLNRLLGSPEVLARAKEAGLAAARDRYCWERVAPQLVESVVAATRAGAKAGSGTR